MECVVFAKEELYVDAIMCTLPDSFEEDALVRFGALPMWLGVVGAAPL